MTGISDGQAITFIIGVVFLVTYFTQKKRKSRESKENLYELGKTINAKLQTGGSLVDDVMIAVGKDVSVRDIFDWYFDLSIEERRAQFCSICLKASYGVYDIECAPLSKEFVSAHSPHIRTLPKELQVFYQSSRSIYTINPDDILLSSLRVHLCEKEELQKTKQQKQEELVTWNEIFLPEDIKSRNREIEMLSQAFSGKQLVFRFVKRTNFWSNNEKAGGFSIVVK